jgi:hypothetical protein
MGKELIWKVVAAVAILLAIGFGFDSCGAHAQNKKLLLESTGVHELIEVEKNKNTSLAKAVSELRGENTNLSDLVAKLRAAPQEVEFITVIETVLVPSEPVVVASEIPFYQQHVLDPGIVVGDFRSNGGSPPYTFTTYSLSFKNSIVTSKKTTSSLLQVSSSYAPDTWIEVPVDLDVAHIDDTPLFEPHLGVGLTGTIAIPPYTTTIADYWGTVFLSTIHPTEDIDLAGITVGANSKAVAVGVDVGGLNIGAPLPLVDDLWIHAGYQLDTRLVSSVGLRLGTKL